MDQIKKPRGGAGRGQGRKPGSKNKAVLERENAALAEQLRTLRSPRKTDLAVMLEIRDYWMGVAAQEQKQAAAANRPPDIDIMGRALEYAGLMASKRAPFLHARLNPVTIRDEPLDMSRLNDDELAELERIREKASVAGGDPGRAGATLQ